MGHCFMPKIKWGDTKKEFHQGGLTVGLRNGEETSPWRLHPLTFPLLMTGLPSLPPSLLYWNRSKLYSDLTPSILPTTLHHGARVGVDFTYNLGVVTTNSFLIYQPAFLKVYFKISQNIFLKIYFSKYISQNIFLKIYFKISQMIDHHLSSISCNHGKWLTGSDQSSREPTLPWSKGRSRLYLQPS